MSDDEGFQLLIDYDRGDGQRTATGNNVSAGEIAKVTAYWRRPSLLRFGTLNLIEADTGKSLGIPWRYVLSIRSQPQREAIQ